MSALWTEVQSLRFLAPIVSDLATPDTLVVLGTGLAPDAVLLSYLARYATPRSLLLVLGMTASQCELLSVALTAARLKPITYLTSSTPLERQHAYLAGGVVATTPRNLIVDILSHTIPYAALTGLLLLRPQSSTTIALPTTASAAAAAAAATPASSDGASDGSAAPAATATTATTTSANSNAGDSGSGGSGASSGSHYEFALRLFRTRAPASAFVSSLTDDPLAVARGGGLALERLLRALTLSRIRLWPRFNALVVAGLEPQRAQAWPQSPQVLLTTSPAGFHLRPLLLRSGEGMTRPQSPVSHQHQQQSVWPRALQSLLLQQAPIVLTATKADASDTTTVVASTRAGVSSNANRPFGGLMVTQLGGTAMSDREQSTSDRVQRTDTDCELSHLSERTVTDPEQYESDCEQALWVMECTSRGYDYTPPRFSNTTVNTTNTSANASASSRINITDSSSWQQPAYVVPSGPPIGYGAAVLPGIHWHAQRLASLAGIVASAVTSAVSVAAATAAAVGYAAGAATNSPPQSFEGRSSSLQ